jgi:hypothetical protein
MELVISNKISEQSNLQVSAIPKGGGGGASKRRRGDMGDDIMSDGVTPPSNDLYISRQQKRANAN